MIIRYIEGDATEPAGGGLIKSILCQSSTGFADPLGMKRTVTVHDFSRAASAVE
jgi:hypothetical protein